MSEQDRPPMTVGLLMEILQQQKITNRLLEAMLAHATVDERQANAEKTLRDGARIMQIDGDDTQIERYPQEDGSWLVITSTRDPDDDDSQIFISGFHEAPDGSRTILMVDESGNLVEADR